MRKSECTQFFEKYLCEVSKGRSYREHENPAVQFSRDTKAGKYNCISDEEYRILLQNVKDLSEFWLSRPNQKASDLLRVALENIDIDRKSLHKIAEVLSECYSASVKAFDSENFTQKQDDVDDDDDDDDDDCDFDDFDDSDDFDDFHDFDDFDDCDTMPQKKRSLPFPENYLGESKTDDAVLNSPREIYKWISDRIYQQEEAVKAAAMLLYNHIQGRKRNILFIGPTGSGKTQIWRVCRQLYPNIRIIDSTMITGEGWSGTFKIKNIFDEMSQKEAEEAIIVFDEFDKFCEPQIGSGNTNHSLIGQNELLKIIEGTTVPLKNFNIDTSKISFVFCGSFERLTEKKTDKEAEQTIGFGACLEKKEAYRVYETVLQPSDLVKYAGMRQEIAGRINQIVQLSPMTATAYREILKNDQISPLHRLEREYGVKLRLDSDTEQKLVWEAEETRMGVRYLHSRIQQMLDEQIFQDCDRTEYMLAI